MAVTTTITLDNLCQLTRYSAADKQNLYNVTIIKVVTESTVDQELALK